MGVRTAGLVLALVVLGFAALLSLSVGARSIPLAEVVEALRHGGDSRNAVVVADVRVPRTLLALAVGVALGIAGALMQALTRSPRAARRRAWTAGAFAVLLALGGAGTDAALGMIVVQLLANGVLQQMLQPIAYGAALGIHPGWRCSS